MRHVATSSTEASALTGSAWRRKHQIRVRETVITLKLIQETKQFTSSFLHQYQQQFVWMKRLLIHITVIDENLHSFCAHFLNIWQHFSGNLPIVVEIRSFSYAFYGAAHEKYVN